jgi:WD40 repeat protein
MDCDPTSTLIATGSADSTIKVWDVERGFCTHNLKGHSGIISALKFQPIRGKVKLASGSDDTSIRIWDLMTKATEFVLDEHMSVIRGLDFSSDGKVLVSGGRDQILISWDLETGKSIRTLPVFEVSLLEESMGPINEVIFQSVEDVKVISDPKGLFDTDDLVVISGGENGKSLAIFKISYILTKSGLLKIWNMISGEAIANQSPKTGGPAITGLL